MGRGRLTATGYDDGEVTHYNATVRADSQPVLSETDRLTEADFLVACSPPLRTNSNPHTAIEGSAPVAD